MQPQHMHPRQRRPPLGGVPLTHHVGQDRHQVLQVVQGNAVLEEGAEVGHRFHGKHPVIGGSRPSVEDANGPMARELS